MARPVNRSVKKDSSKGKKSGTGKGSSESATFKRNNLDDSSSTEKRAPTKRASKGKYDSKPTFKRHKDESRPSDFGTTSAQVKSDLKKVPPKKVSTRPSFKGKVSKQPKSFGGKSYSEKPSIAPKGKINPNDIDEKDLDFESKSSYEDRGRGFKRAKLKAKKGGESTAPQMGVDDGTTRLNKYLSNAGICSRREADQLIATGVVQVNGKTVTEMGYKVKPTDIVNYGGQTLKKERLVYLILNKPKDYITTASDPRERKTVLELVSGACKERIYPVGRLDRATTGLLMFTNDGDLTKKLTHPRYGVKKLYHVVLDKPLKKADLEKITAGLELEDGPIKVDEIMYVANGADKTQVGVQIHSGKNRIVRRIFSHMGYNVRKLDRVMFGSLTKKDLPRGRWRILSEAEVGMLKMISAD